MGGAGVKAPHKDVLSSNVQQRCRRVDSWASLLYFWHCSTKAVHSVCPSHAQIWIYPLTSKLTRDKDFPEGTIAYFLHIQRDSELMFKSKTMVGLVCSISLCAPHRQQRRWCWLMLLQQTKIDSWIKDKKTACWHEFWNCTALLQNWEDSFGLKHK